MIARAATALLLFQLIGPTAGAPEAEPQFFRYQRGVEVPLGSSGQSCVVIDAAVFAHAAHQSLEDVRLYTNAHREVQYSLTESGATAVSDEEAEIRHLVAGPNGDISFDLAMPKRPYTAIELKLDAKDFVAKATVSAVEASGTNQLGTFPLFDLSSQHLARLTTLPLQETSFNDLHVVMQVRPEQGGKAHAFPASIVRGAAVPPSREAQTLYTPVATIASFTQRGGESFASVHIPAHVPVERVSFALANDYGGDFLRSVQIAARPDGADDNSEVETVTGDISATTLPDALTGYATNVTFKNLALDAVLGADLRRGATVELTVANEDRKPLPGLSAQLEMRERRICFDADASVPSYELRYGDDELKAPAYDHARFFAPSPRPVLAKLGPEQPTPNFRERRESLSYRERHPEAVWLFLIAVIAALGSFALRRTRRRH